MARGASAGNASQNVSRGGSRGAAGPVAQRDGAGGLRTRSSGNKGSSAGGMGLTRFFTDESQGLKIGPTAVMVSSLVFIFTVVILHIFGKLTS